MNTEEYNQVIKDIKLELTKPVLPEDLGFNEDYEDYTEECINSITKTILK